jgi:hypothetical protein
MEIVTQTRSDFSPSYSLSPLGLNIEGEIGFDEWRNIASNIGTALRSAAFCIGDWLVYGEDKWGKQLALAGMDAPRGQVTSEAYTEAMALTGLDLSTLRTYASVCRTIPLAERDPRLSFEHHKALAPIPAPKRPEWLALVSAQTAPVSVRKLRASIRISGGDRPRLASPDELLSRPQAVGRDNYIPHLQRLSTTLFKTIPGMTANQRMALKADTAQLVALLQGL